jgi:hypothetical protein
MRVKNAKRLKECVSLLFVQSWMTKFNFQTENDVEALWRKEEQQDQKAQFTGKVARERERE